MRRERAFSAVFMIVLVPLSILIALDLREAGAMVSADKKLEHYTKLFLAVASGLGAVCFAYLTFAVEDRRREEDREHDIASERLKADYSERITRLEVEAKKIEKYLELEYNEDFRRREIRYRALQALSREVAKTTKSFVHLSNFPLLLDTSTEALLPVLANALSARFEFLEARDELLAMRMLQADHEQLLQEYSNQLLEIFIDVRRLDPAKPKDRESFERGVKQHRDKLIELDEKIGKTLAVFLAPKARLKGRAPVLEHPPEGYDGKRRT